MAYTLAIPDRMRRRTLGYLKQNWIDFEESPSMEGFFDIIFPDMDEYDFRDITNKLKQQGVTIIGADKQLTNKSIMKLSDLMNEQNITEDESDIIEDLKRILKTWETKEYDSPEDRYQEYFLDIQELVEDYEEEMVLNKPDLTNLSEARKRKFIRKELKRLMQ
tara:strand:+ start:276 stop:764 length:489 start_codon:yes stop_codon:yes gene_type:complete